MTTFGTEPAPVPPEAVELMRQHRLHQDRAGHLPASIARRDIYLKAFARSMGPRGCSRRSGTTSRGFSTSGRRETVGS